MMNKKLSIIIAVLVSIVAFVLLFLMLQYNSKYKMEAEVTNLLNSYESTSTINNQNIFVDSLHIAKPDSLKNSTNYSRTRHADNIKYNNMVYYLIIVILIVVIMVLLLLTSSQENKRKKIIKNKLIESNLGRISNIDNIYYEYLEFISDVAVKHDFDKFSFWTNFWNLYELEDMVKLNTELKAAFQNSKLSTEKKDQLLKELNVKILNELKKIRRKNIEIQHFV